ncbi:MAG: hypothetical protein H0X66_06135 [Verrucomicrobia bacterium]|nr:hypothetical protein [Verrucomicrobiota bacterium]
MAFSTLFSTAETNSTNTVSRPISPEQHARNAYLTYQARFEINPSHPELAWQFSRAAFDWAEFASNNRQREQIALQGIAAARRGIVLETNSVPAHYYLGMNLGQLARTKSIGALKLVGEMEREFKKVRVLDETYDFAGPDRNLGLLYLEAPSSFSIGDRKKAREHLLKAVELSPTYPENRLNLIEAYLKWNDSKSAQTAFNELEQIWTAARKEFAGEEWRTSWVDWEKRRSKALEKLRSMTPRR